MIDARELRIGNTIHFNRHGKSGDVVVSQIYIHDVSRGIGVSANGMFLNINEIQPIPLTEEWLLKFGFIYLSEIRIFSKSGYDVELIDKRY